MINVNDLFYCYLSDYILPRSISCILSDFDVRIPDSYVSTTSNAAVDVLWTIGVPTCEGGYHYQLSQFHTWMLAIERVLVQSTLSGCTSP